MHRSVDEVPRQLLLILTLIRNQFKKVKSAGGSVGPSYFRFVLLRQIKTRSDVGSFRPKTFTILLAKFLIQSPGSRTSALSTAKPQGTWKVGGAALGWSCFGASGHGPLSFRRVGQSVDLPGKARRWGHDLRGSRQSGCLKPWSRPPQPRRTPSLASGG